MEFPKGYIEARKNIIPDIQQFLESYKQMPVKSFFVNTNKIDENEFIKSTDWNVEKCAEGWKLLDDIKVGKTPEHHSGMIYMQELSAMMPATFLPVKPTDWVLDMCSAPGGKAIQTALKLKDGLLVANEIVRSRANVLKSNVERMGLSNVCVINNDPKQLEDCCEGIFDAIIVDAPCSGEGMFRKDEDARLNWSQANVEACAIRQKAILETANKLLRTGGYLLYSTCTFSVEENEQVVADFCSKHNYKIIPLEYNGAVNGIKIDGFETNKCLRFYPHKFSGEGQFVALLQKAEASFERVDCVKKLKPLNKLPTEYKLFVEFCAKNLEKYDDILDGAICNNGIIYYCKYRAIAESGVNLVNCGVILGEVAKGRFEPHHNIATAFGDRFINKIDLNVDDVYKYLRGETLPIRSGGYIAVAHKGIVIGLGKGGDIIKNHYPKGLRNL